MLKFSLSGNQPFQRAPFFFLRRSRVERWRRKEETGEKEEGRGGECGRESELERWRDDGVWRPRTFCVFETPFPSVLLPVVWWWCDG